MSDLIGREDAIEAMCRECGNMEEYGDCSCGCAEKNAIESLPSAEAVQVVRCKNCKHLYKDGECPLRTWFTHTADDFCSYGERREDGEKHE